MNLVPTKATMAIARRMVSEAPSDGADVVLAYYRDVNPDQIPALVGILARWASGQAVVLVDRPGVWSADPGWICAEAQARAAERFGVDFDGIRNSQRGHYVAARAVAMAAVVHAGVSYAEAGRRFERDHSTVMSADRKVRRSPELWAIAESIGDGLRMPGTAVA